MEGFIKSYKSIFELRNLILIIYSLTAFKVTWDFTNVGLILPKIALLIFLLIFTYCAMELLFSKMFDVVYILCLLIFCISVIIEIMMADINVIVASATLMLVIVTAYSVTTTNQIARKQLKLQNDPLVILSVKENDNNVQIIDLIIENVGNGIAKNIRFEPSPHGFITMSGDPIKNLYFFQNGIQILAPKQKYTIQLVNFAQKVREIRERLNLPPDGELSKSEAQMFRQIVRIESELEFTVYSENNEGEQNRSVFYFNLCIFWGLRFPVR